ncbi:DUF3953 domain-containing protein [Sporosarcina aquimarina]|uniref:DUF3953 domain-containing protein n=1 Tax=Sporosarcina aquimarina TaxID=114975 RepID=A0ABU4FY79_9BACL|nr:DUF3953 domain-containing protein [Sporosarcina aquimarina]MDW0109689.1 DUF3953 domain-containing protein [Sporosarcina aquimarina]
MKILHLILSIIVVISGVFTIVTKNFDYILFYLVLLGTLIVSTGIGEIRRKENEFNAYMSIIVFGMLIIYYLVVFVFN